MVYRSWQEEGAVRQTEGCPPLAAAFFDTAYP